MKKLILMSIGAVILIITLLCEMVLSGMDTSWLKDEQWSNYVHRWDMKWKSSKKVSLATRDVEITLCETKR
jgi:hypothetical protein